MFTEQERPSSIKFPPKWEQVIRKLTHGNPFLGSEPTVFLEPIASLYSNLIRSPRLFSSECEQTFLTTLLNSSTPPFALIKATDHFLNSGLFTAGYAPASNNFNQLVQRVVPCCFENSLISSYFEQIKEKKYVWTQQQFNLLITELTATTGVCSIFLHEIIEQLKHPSPAFSISSISCIKNEPQRQRQRSETISTSDSYEASSPVV